MDPPTLQRGGVKSMFNCPRPLNTLTVKTRGNKLFPIMNITAIQGFGL